MTNKGKMTPDTFNLYDKQFLPGFSLWLNIHDIIVNCESNNELFIKEMGQEYTKYIIEDGSHSENIKLFFYDLSRDPSLDQKLSQLEESGHNIETIRLFKRTLNVIDYTDFSLNLFVRDDWNIDEVILLLTGSLGAMVRYRLSQRSKVAAFHAASFAWEDEGILLIGDSGAGKTSLSYVCTKQGFKYLSDESSLIEEDGDKWQILAYQRRLRLDNATLPYFPEISQPQDMTRPFNIFNQQGYIVDLNKILPESYSLKAPLKAVVVLKNDKDCTVSTISLMNKSLARLHLLHSLESAPYTDFLFEKDNNLNRQGFYMVDNLLDSMKVFEIKYNIRKHVLEIPRKLREILDLATKEKTLKP